MLGLNDPDDPFQRPPFDMLLGWEDEIPTEQDDIADLFKS